MDRAAFKSHPFWATVDSTATLLEDHSPASAEEIDAYERLQGIIDYTQTLRDSITVELVCSSMLTNAQNHWNAIDSNLTQYSASKNISYLTSAATQVDTMLQALGSWPQAIGAGPRAAQAQAAFEASSE